MIEKQNYLTLCDLLNSCRNITAMCRQNRDLIDEADHQQLRRIREIVASRLRVVRITNALPLASWLDLTWAYRDPISGDIRLFRTEQAARDHVAAYPEEGLTHD